MCVDLNEVKAYIRVEHNADDDLITRLIDSATQLVETRLRRKVIGTEETALADSNANVPASVKIAVCVIVAFMYENRAATDEELRSRVLRQALLDQFILWE